MFKYDIKHREFTGPTPHTVAILGRPPNKRPPEHLILERRRIEDLREKSIADSKYRKECDLRSRWVLSTDKNIMKNNVSREVTKQIHADDMNLEQRREKLRDMLLAEEEQYMQEMEAREETIEDRQQQMKERAKFLKEKREAERLAYVEEKLDERFKEDCEELRAETVKRTRDEIFEDRKMQIKIKEENKNQQKEIEKYYADLWHEDTKAKALREEFEMKEQIQKNMEALKVLNVQKRALEVQREEEKLIKQAEAEWLKEEAALRAHEEKLLDLEKKEKQRQVRRERIIDTKLAMKKAAREKQEELAIDMKILDKILFDSATEAQDIANKKVQQRDEMQRFMHYVAKTRKEQEIQDKQLEDLVSEEVQKKWREKDEKKKLEKQARKMLMENVMKIREEQIKEREMIMNKEQEAVMKERENLHEQMEEYRRLENEKINMVRKENQKYQNDLEQQMEYQRKLKEKETEDARRELAALNNAEVDYQKRLRSALHKPAKKLHPLRVEGYNKNSLQSLSI